MKHLVLKNLAGHSRRNTKTAIMVTVALAFVIFAGSVFTLESNSIGDFVYLASGSDVIVSAVDWDTPVPEVRQHVPCTHFARKI